MRITKKTILFTLLFFISIVPRGMELLSNSNYFGYEQGMEYQITKKIFVDREIILVAPQGGFGNILKPAGFNYLLGIPFVIASGNPFGGRIFMFAISVLTIIVAILLTRRMFNSVTAFFICTLLTISSNLSHLAGRIYTPDFIPILTILLLFAFFKFIKGDKRFIFIVAFLIGLTAHFEMATAGKLMFIFIGGLFFLLVRKTISYRYLFISVLCLSIPLLPLLIFDLSHNFQNINGVIQLFHAGRHRVGQIFISSFINILNNRLDVFGWNFRSTFSPHFLIWPAILLWIFGGFFVYLREKNTNLSEKKFTFVLVMMPFLYFAMLIFYPGNIVQWWLFELSVFYCFLLGIIFGFFWNKNYLRPLIILTLFVLLISFIHRTFALYKHEFILHSTIDSYVRESDPIKYIFQDAKKNPFNIIVFSPNELDNYDYLIWWYGTSKYHYSPDIQKSDTLYMLFERDYFRSLGGNNLSKIFQVGKVVDTKVFGSGFIVKKVRAKGYYGK